MVGTEWKKQIKDTRYYTIAENENELSDWLEYIIKVMYSLAQAKEKCIPIYRKMDETAKRLIV